MSNERRYPRRLIEVDLPIKEISAHARREKSTRHGHISTLHIWWARRPLAACRAVILAALWPDPADPLCPERFRVEAAKAMKQWRNNRGGPQRNWDDPAAVRAALLSFIAEFANWDNSTSAAHLEVARRLVQVAHESLGGAPGTRPLVVDPFAGGGAIPLEALRVGAEALASDLNPVAVLLNRLALDHLVSQDEELLPHFIEWATWVKAAASKRLAAYYPSSDAHTQSAAYLWARTVKCEGPACGVTIPMLRSFDLSRKSKGHFLKLAYPDGADLPVLTLHEGTGKKEAHPGTNRRSAATCPRCGYTTKRSNIELQAKRGVLGEMLIAVVERDGEGNRRYRLPSRSDVAAFAAAQEDLASRIRRDATRYGLEEELPYLRSIFNVRVYGIDTWGKLFNNRQRLALLSFSDIVAYELPTALAQSQTPPDIRDTVRLLLAVCVDRVADYTSSLCRWDLDQERTINTFCRQALGMVWDYAENNPLAWTVGSWDSMQESIARVIRQQSALRVRAATVSQGSAIAPFLPDDSADYLFTDPPYYDAIPYANLSDFFLIWLKRSLPETGWADLEDGLAPKVNEIVQLAERNKQYAHKTRQFFETGMTEALGNGRRYVKPDGVATIVFAHKETASWEAMLSAVLNAGWVTTASWPIDTEQSQRLRARNAAALASSIHLVCRPRENPDGSVKTDAVGDWRAVLRELPVRIHEWMPRLAKEGVVGADAIFACLGPALEIFSRYSRVEKASGERVELREYLEHVWAAVAREALSMIFEDADATGLEEDARLTAMWLWTQSTSANGGGNGSASTSGDDEDESAGEDEEEEESTGKAKAAAGFSLEFDAARKIAQGLGAHLEDLGRVVEVKGDQARLLSVAERTRHLFGKDQAQRAPARPAKKAKQLTLFEELEAAEKDAGWGDVGLPPLGESTLDRVHQAMVLFAAGRGEALRRFLVEEGVGRAATFWKLAQSLSALYPAGTDEKRWLDGVLARKKGLGFG